MPLLRLWISRCCQSGGALPAVALDRLPEIVGRQLTTYGKVHKERPDGREVQASGRCPDPSSPEGRRPADRARCALSVAGAPCREDGAVRARQPAKAVSSCAGASAFRLTASPPPEGGGACPVRCAMWARKGLEDGSAVVPVCCAGPDALGERAVRPAGSGALPDDRAGAALDRSLGGMAHAPAPRGSKRSFGPLRRPGDHFLAGC